MPHVPNVTFDSPPLLAAAIALTVACATIALVRRAIIPRAASALALMGLLCLALSAGGFRIARAGNGDEVAVMIDASSSTRGAAYHDPQTLKKRVAELLGRTPYRVHQFAAEARPAALEASPDEIATTQTTFDPPARAIAVLLFSDGQFELPAACPPVYAVVDPALERVNDGAIMDMQWHDRNVAIDVRNTGAARQLTLTHATPSTQPVPADHMLLSARADDASSTVTARLQGHDRWPENDTLTVRPPPAAKLQRWWISHRAAPDATWRVFDPPNVPFDTGEYLAAGVIVVDNVASNQFDVRQRQRIEQYVHQLGGGLIFLGGEHAFAAGEFIGTRFDRIFEELSPLASSPPRAVMHWVFLADSSGSMAARIGDNSRWRFATTAITNSVTTLPPADLLTAGNFAADVRWWQRGRSVAETDLRNFVPNEVQPSGPTNLQPALDQIARDADGAVPTHLTIITDAETKMPDPSPLLEQFRSKRITLHAITTSTLPADHPLRKLVHDSGGQFFAQDRPQLWDYTLQGLIDAVRPDGLMRTSVSVEFTEAGPDLASQSISLWNRTWLKPRATLLARTIDAADPAPMIAAWNLGAGAVISAAYSPSPRVVDALAERVMVPPRDPRFAVSWTTGSRPRVRIDAQQDGRQLNDLALRLQLSTASIAIPQTAPGRYELTIDPPSRSTIAQISLDNTIIDRHALPGRYVREFDGIGNNRANLAALAEQTGGALIESSNQSPIEFRHRPRANSMASPLAVAGFILLAAGIIRWRLA